MDDPQLAQIISQASQRLAAGMADRRKSRFGPGFDTLSLKTVAECDAALEELDREIAAISAQQELLAASEADAFDPEAASRLHRVRTAHFHRRRIANEVKLLKRRLLGVEPDLPQMSKEIAGGKLATLNAQIMLQREIEARKAAEHERKLQCIEATNRDRLTRERLFARKVRERFGDEVTDSIWAEVEREFASGR